jgi:hypothetical protein
MPTGGEEGLQLPDAMVSAVQVGDAHPIGFLPEQINYVDCLAGIVGIEHRPQPTLLIQGFAFESEFHPLSAWLDLQVRDTWIKSKALCERNTLSELLRVQQFLCLSLHARKR